MAEMEKNPIWRAGEMLEKALVLAVSLHKDQARKVDREPYIGHLLGTASLVIEHGGDEEQACAALLHDSIEDAGISKVELATLLNDNIAEMVAVCTDTPPGAADVQSPEVKRANWKERKAAYHASIHDKRKLQKDAVERRAILVGVCDKINNCEKSVNDRRRMSADQLWGGFNATPDMQHWNYRQLIAAYREAADPTSAGTLRAIDRLERAVDLLFPEFSPTGDAR